MGMGRYTASLFIFRRDLRIHDNSALNQAVSASDRVLPCFVFDPRQIKKHPYQSQPALQFMMQSIADLQQAFQGIGFKLALYGGFPVDVVKQVFKQHRIQAVFVNRDYTAFSRLRDTELTQVCQDLNIDFHVVPDYLLTEPEQALKNDGSPYKVFTAFYNNARQLPVPLPKTLEKPNFIRVDGESVIDQSVLAPSTPQQNEAIVHIPPGGRSQALAILEALDRQRDYKTLRDYPFLDATSRLSPHLKFGTCSVREAYYAIVRQLGPEHPLLRQLYWRDFFTHIAFHYAHVFGKAFHSQYDNLVWDNNPDYFQRWSEGKTGFPIVDAGMRELNATGFMHNGILPNIWSIMIPASITATGNGPPRQDAMPSLISGYLTPGYNNRNLTWIASISIAGYPNLKGLQQPSFINGTANIQVTATPRLWSIMPVKVK
jgi:deoxyribodipyrimidine photo-lyase